MIFRLDFGKKIFPMRLIVELQVSFVPKAEGLRGIRLVCNKIRELADQNIVDGEIKNTIEDFQVIPLIETAKGVQFVYEIASVRPNDIKACLWINRFFTGY